MAQKKSVAIVGSGNIDIPVIEIDGAELAVTPVNVNYAASGDLKGTWDETTWWTDEHLPVRIERTLDLSGPATFSETSKLQLTSRTPAS